MPMPPVTVYEPKIRVTLYKTVARKSLGGKAVTSDRFQGTVQQQAIDLTPFMGDGSSWRTSKSVREPAGSFQLTLLDSPLLAGGSFESLYGLIEPQDMIEIRARHALTGVGQPPIIMRGFVSEVSRSEGMSQDGRPARSVMVSGQDYGKVWQIIQILYFVDYIVGQNYISEFKLFEKFGVGFKTAMPAKEFVETVLQKIVNKFLGEMLPEKFPLPREVRADVSVKHGTVSPGIQSQEGTIYELLRTFGDVGPWNELFLEDREDGVYCVYRPNPYLTATDSPPKKIQDDAPDPVYVDVSAVDIMAISVSRGDGNVSNYYWASSARFDLVTEAYRRQWGLTAKDNSTVDLGKYTNSQVALYGVRLMQVATQQGGDEMQTHNTGSKSDGQSSLETSVANWINNRRKIVVDQNKDNILFERGTIRMRGDERVRAGTYLRVTRGASKAIYYVVSVDHEFVPFAGFFTTVQFERGTGFIARVQAGGSPYLTELT
ncbi:MAG: hypothetical protein AB9M53_00955 [Leptothrix sp. (in: b-proteobacteria)]